MIEVTYKVYHTDENGITLYEDGEAVYDIHIGKVLQFIPVHHSRDSDEGNVVQPYIIAVVVDMATGEFHELLTSEIKAV